MSVLAALVLALVPSLFLLRFFYRRDVHREPGRGILITFLLGIAIVIPVGVLGVIFLGLDPDSGNPLAAGILVAFVGAAIPEEAAKYLVLTRYSARRAAFDEPMDGVVYGVTASLGFATFENILYVLEGGWGVAILRGLTAVPGHAFLGAILGYFVGRSRFVTNSRATAVWGLLVAIVFHGLYDVAPMTIVEWDQRGTLDVEQGSDVWLLLLLLAGMLIVLTAEAIFTLVVVRRLRRRQLAGE